MRTLTASLGNETWVWASLVWGNETGLSLATVICLGQILEVTVTFEETLSYGASLATTSPTCPPLVEVVLVAVALLATPQNAWADPHLGEAPSA